MYHLPIRSSLQTKKAIPWSNFISNNRMWQMLLWSRVLHINLKIITQQAGFVAKSRQWVLYVWTGLDPFNACTAVFHCYQLWIKLCDINYSMTWNSYLNCIFKNPPPFSWSHHFRWSTYTWHTMYKFIDMQRSHLCPSGCCRKFFSKKMLPVPSRFC